MEVFDYRTFDEHKSGGHYAYSLPDGSEIEQWETPGESYMEVVRTARTNYSVYRLFFHDTKTLMKKGDQFFQFPVGVWRTYDRKGNMTSESRPDSVFAFGVERLAELMRKRGVEINVRGNGVGVMREDSPRPLYTVVFQNVPGDDSEIRFVGVDGITGQVVAEQTKKRTKD